MRWENTIKRVKRWDWEECENKCIESIKRAWGEMRKGVDRVREEHGMRWKTKY